MPVKTGFDDLLFDVNRYFGSSSYVLCCACASVCMCVNVVPVCVCVFSIFLSLFLLAVFWYVFEV